MANRHLEPDADGSDLRTRVRARIGSFRRATDGNVLILFGFLSVPILMFTGAAVDYGLATRLETKLQAATDATALLLCQTKLSTSTVDLNALALSAMTGAMGVTNLVVDPLVITTNPRKITLKTHKVSPTFFGKFTGTATLNPGASAQCATPAPTAFEIALVLDNTGSMENAGDDGVSKISALRSAAKDFVKSVFDPTTYVTGTKMSLVPFAASVAVPSSYRTASWVDTLGKSKYHWTNVTGATAAGFTSRFDIFTKLKAAYSGWGWAGCFESLPYPQNVSDTGVSGNDTLYIPYFAPDDAGQGSVAPKAYDSNNTFFGYNSYIDDASGTATCPALATQSTSASYLLAEGRACKYVSPTNAKPGTYFSEVGANGPNFGCTTQPLLTLTTSTSTLNSTIDNMAPAGITNIHEGFMWGWRTISPKSVMADGTASAYGSASISKMIVLMTDGENSWLDNGYSPNKSLFASNGFFVNVDGTDPDAHFPAANQNIANGTQGRAGIDALTREACTNAGTAGVLIFTIGFSVSSDQIDAQGIQLLKDCAAAGKGKYFQANDSTSLIQAFKDIQSSIGSLRLTQ